MTQKNDERLTKGPDSRTSPITARVSDDNRDSGGRGRLEAGVRADRTDGVDRLTEADRTTPEGERAQTLRRNPWDSEVLATPPQLPGWHWFWATTTNQADPVHRRLQMGYELAKPEDVPGCEFLTLKGGDFDGAIACNEMILLKLPEGLYRHWMKSMHHDMPLNEDGRIASMIETIRDQARDSQGQPLIRDVGDGTQELMSNGRIREPIFNP